MKVLGIDPGRSGGATLLTTPIYGGVLSVHSFTEDDAFIEWFEEILKEGVDAVFMEKVTSFRGEAASRAHTFGDNTGFLRGVVRAHHLPFNWVTPAKWQAGLGIPPGLDRAVRKRKLKNKASELYPQHRWTLQTADAVLIARYGLNALSRTISKS